MAIAWAPETRIVPIAPPCAVAMAQIVSSVCCIFTMSFAFKITQRYGFSAYIRKSLGDNYS